MFDFSQICNEEGEIVLSGKPCIEYDNFMLFCLNDLANTQLDPFSSQDKTYFTNGHILLRVDRILAAVDLTVAGKHKNNLVDKMDYLLQRIPDKFHRIPEMCCDFEQSNMDWITFEGVKFRVRYLALISLLPDVIIGTFGPMEPAVFRFDGGEGILMPVGLL